MENALYSINLAIHIAAACLCVGGPFYQLRWVRMRGKLGYNIIYPFDKVMENTLHFQTKLCALNKTILLTTGFAFPLIYYIFHGTWRDVSTIALFIFSAKVILTLLGGVINSYTFFLLDFNIRKIFSLFLPHEQPRDEVLNRFWALRQRRTVMCRICFILVFVTALLTAWLRFYK